MTRKAMLLLIMTIVAAAPLHAREKSDVVIMKNGDRITCEIKGLRSDILFIKVGYILTTLSVNWRQVDHLESKQLFLVTTRDGTVYTGTLSTPKVPAGQPMQIEVFETPGKKNTLEVEQVSEVDETSQTVWQRLSGQVGLGFAYSKGNQTSQYNLNSQMAYAEQTWSAGADFNSNLSSNSASNVSTRNEVTFSGQRLMRWNNWYYIGIADFLQSTVQGIQLQDTFGGGVGRNIKNSGSRSFTIYGGFAWQQINYKEANFSPRTQQVAAALLGARLRLFQFDRSSLVVNADLLPALTDPGRLHFNLSSSYYVKLWGKLNWNFGINGNWDNRPPPGFSTSDYSASSGISVNFGNR